MEALMGMVVLFAGNFAPQNWMFCDGASVSINQNQALFAILGTQYGGDGQTVFQLPKLEDPSGLKYIICVQGIFPSRG